MELHSLLNWGLENSDPTQLAQDAEAVRRGEKEPLHVVRLNFRILSNSILIFLLIYAGADLPISDPPTCRIKNGWTS
jgi:hypothetical protein